jgi:hypothetical protein
MITEYKKFTDVENTFSFDKNLQEQNPASYLGDDIAALGAWLEEIKSEDCLFYAKRLSGNDTGATKSHQAGIYFPKKAMADIFPEMDHIESDNPDHFFSAKIDSHSLPEQQLRVIYYNSKLRANGGTRNEKRITRWKESAPTTPLQDTENTGALALFAFFKSAPDINAEYLKVWLCRTPEEESYAELILGEILPGNGVFGPPLIIFGGAAVMQGKIQSARILPSGWENVFPTGIEILDFVFQKFPYGDLSSDERLLKRRNKEFDVFRTIEKAHSMHLISNGFSSVDDFIAVANSIANRRKSRAGKSLELHLEHIFQEEGLNKFSSQCITENNKKPDFIFPSCKDYGDLSYPSQKLRMLAVKTTCKDRWRQVLNEANRIDAPFLFTLQEGVSLNQYMEMKHENVTLVVPADLHKSYPKEIRDQLLTLNTFIQETKALLAG